MAEKTAYISGALTNVAGLDDMRRFYEAIGGVCTESGLVPYIPHQHTDPVKAAQISPTEVWNTDYGVVSRSAVVVAYVGEPSLGVGAELEIAREHKVPIVLLARINDKVSRMARGNPAVKQEIRFETENEALAQLASILRSL